MKKKNQAVAVIGLGYVGLPLAVLIAQSGYRVIALDQNKAKVRLINRGQAPFKDDALQAEMDKVKLQATAKTDGLKKAGIIIVCVPTPIDQLNNPDLRPVKSAAETIRKNLRRGQLIVIESTVNPGVCEEIVAPILEKSGLVMGKDFDLAHCPERINPGDKKWTTRNIPRVVGASSKKGLKRAVAFYKSILNSEVRPMNTIKEAEATKIIENTFRDINIAYVNELAKSFDLLGIDLYEVIKGASTKPFAFLPHYPGCGIGGHCIPVDPYYLIERAKQAGFEHNFLRLARQINKSMPKYALSLLVKELNKLGKSVKTSKIGVLGLAYKPDIDDTRESPVYEIIEGLKELEAYPVIYDPYVPGESTVKSLKELLKKVEVLILATNHREFVELDPKELKRNNIKLVIDGRNALDKEAIKKLGIAYKGIGR